MRSAIVVALALVATPALAQDGIVKTKGPPPVPRFATELVDPAGQTKLQVVTRMTFSDGSSLFGGVAIQSYEARLAVGLFDTYALHVALPVGVLSPPGDAAGESFVGNLMFGGSAGFPVLDEAEGPKLWLSGALDVMLPTSPKPNSTNLVLAQIMVASIRAYEPQLYLPELLTFRLRTQAELALDQLRLTVELALSPGVTTVRGLADEESSQFIMLFGATGRVSYLVGRSVEPFLELGAAIDIAGPAALRPPLLVTPGVRFHIGDLFDPAVFFSFNFVHAPQVLFGVDIAGALRPSEDNKKGGFRDDPLGDDPLGF